MIVEQLKDGDAERVYKRFRDRGRLAPEGLNYVASWVDAKFQKCFQLMETDNFELIEKWIENWKDLVDFEVFPVMTSREAAEKMAQRL